jgi:hypothetical protein
MPTRLTAPVAAATAALVLGGCGGGDGSTAAGRSRTSTLSRRAQPSHQQPAYPRLLASAQSSVPTGFVPVVRLRGLTAAWIARSRSGVALLSFDQRLVGLRLHSGTVDAGGSGRRWGPSVAGTERRGLVAAFNGGFKFSTGAGGFMSDGRVAGPLRDGLGSIVTYDDGYTDIGSWHRELPAAGRPVASVRQNLTLLIDHGHAAATLDCRSCWGATLGGVADPARSALGITSDGHLIWAGGEHLTVAQLVAAVLGARVVRAVELDINPEWVAGYLYRHRGVVGPLAPVPAIPAQVGVPGSFLVRYSRDFFTISAH